MAYETPDELKALRQRIDAIDTDLIALLKQRIGIIHEVASFKRAHTPADCHIRPGREGEMHRHIQQAFAGSDFPPAAALTIWRQIIGASTHLESPITVAVAPSQEPLAWYAREYFGRPVRCIAAKDITDALDATAHKRATIAVLPAPSDANLFEWAKLRDYPALRVFASLPVVLAQGETPACYAVSAVQTEATGHDMSLLLIGRDAIPEGAYVLAQNAEHALIAHDGASDAAQCLGILPKPITDTSLNPW